MPKNMENIAYVQFDSVETAKKYKEMDLEINSVPISSKFVPDRMSAERKRTKGTKWEKKKAAKREAAIAEKKNGDDSKSGKVSPETSFKLLFRKYERKCS